MQEQMQIFEQGWAGNDTVCGWGSTMEHTKTIRTMLPVILEITKAKTMNDAGCGDLFWIQHLNLSNIDYVGYDLYERSTWPALREKGWKLETADVTKDFLRESDITMCRDVFIHLPNHMVQSALHRLKQTTKYLFTTFYKSPTINPKDYKPEYTFDNYKRMESPRLQHAKLDLSKMPFNLGEPLLIIPENYPHKYMGLWRLRRR